MTSEHLDLAKVMECYGGSPQVLLKTLRRINTTLPGDWALFMSSCEAGDSDMASVVAHRMAGTVAMIGADDFANFLRELSRTAKSKKSIPSPLLSRALKYYDEVMAELGAVVARFPLEAPAP
ncbi:MAG TPA: hypothetical protein VLA24_08210 [Pseudomonadales bacterium]|nr:hypothetical protein [Pseudomonadales bacterium]